MDLWRKLSLIQKIMMGTVFGIIVGLLFPQLTGLSILGTLFVGALKGIAPILVFFLIMASISQQELGAQSYIKSVLVLYGGATLLAAIIAVTASYLFPVSIPLADVAAQGDTGSKSLIEVLNEMLGNLVMNPVKSIAEGNFLGILFWSSLLGIGLRHASTQTKDVLSHFSAAVTKVIQFIIQLAPIGIFGLVYDAIVTTGVGALVKYGQLVLVLVGAMAFTALIAYPLMVFLYIKKNPFPLVFYTLKETGLHAFFTRSSAVVVPFNLQAAKKLGLNEQSYNLSLTLGASINSGGAAITITVMTLAAVHTLGIQVHPIMTFLLCLVSALASCGASGIAGGSLLLIPICCSLFGISNDIAMQIVAVGFIISVIQDSVETALNASADLLFTAAAEFRDKPELYDQNFGKLPQSMPQAD
jgi:serine/threonine transporter